MRDLNYHESILTQWLSTFKSHLTLKEASFFLKHYLQGETHVMNLIKHGHHCNKLDIEYDFTESMKLSYLILKRVPRLTDLKLSFKRIWAFNMSEHDIKALEESFGFIPRVKNLTLDFQHSWNDFQFLFKNKGAAFLDNCLSHLSNLKSLKLKLSFSKKETPWFPLSPISQLEDLELHISIHVSGKMTYDVELPQNYFEFLSNYSQLKKLRIKIDQCDAQDVLLMDLANKISEMPNLEKLHLDIRSNQITDEGLISITDTIRSLVHLKDITLNLSSAKVESSIEVFLSTLLQKEIPKVLISLPSPEGGISSLDSVRIFLLENIKTHSWEIYLGGDKVFPKRVVQHSLLLSGNRSADSQISTKDCSPIAKEKITAKKKIYDMFCSLFNVRGQTN